MFTPSDQVWLALRPSVNNVNNKNRKLLVGENKRYMDQKDRLRKYPIGVFRSVVSIVYRLNKIPVSPVNSRDRGVNNKNRKVVYRRRIEK